MNIVILRTLLHIDQSGFRETYSCETAIVNACDRWLRALDEGKKVLVVFIDFRRAFETVKKIIVRKIEKDRVVWISIWMV